MVTVWPSSPAILNGVGWGRFDIAGPLSSPNPEI